MEKQRTNDKKSMTSGDNPEIRKREENIQAEIIHKITMHQNANILMQGVIWSEVLGRPLFKRKYRGRHGL